MTQEKPELSNTLTKIPGWSTLSAYEMTKHCCAELTRRGEPIPSWTAIRDIIGKGSSGDINRAKKDYRREHGEALRKMEGFIGQGIPDALTPHILGFWETAAKQARTIFDDQTHAWQKQIELADAAVDQAESDRARFSLRVSELESEAVGLQQAIAALHGRVETEQAAREQAERMSESARQDLVGQRDRLDEALARAKKDLDTAILRLEGTERRSMMEIERARQEAVAKVNAITAKLTSEEDKHSLDTARLTKQVHETRTHLTKVQERNAALEQENRSLHERIQRAEQLADSLQAQNRELYASITSRPKAGAVGKPQRSYKAIRGTILSRSKLQSRK